MSVSEHTRICARICTHVQAPSPRPSAEAFRSLRPPARFDASASCACTCRCALPARARAHRRAGAPASRDRPACLGLAPATVCTAAGVGAAPLQPPRLLGSLILFRVQSLLSG
jgi:hypothetical protein